MQRKMTVAYLTACLLCFVLLFVNTVGKPVLELVKEQASLDNKGIPVPPDDAINSNNLRPIDDKIESKLDNALKFESLKNIEKDASLDLMKLKPVDHLDGIRLEQDGHLNKDVHKELFLGNHEEMDADSATADKKLMVIFQRVDTNRDGLLSESEMEQWILLKMKEHFDEAIKENEEIFQHLDRDFNDVIHWKDYYTHFLLAKGYKLEEAKKHVIDYDVIELDAEEKEELMKYKFRWVDADIDPADNQLNRTEFLGFRHPEQSDKTINTMVYSILSSMDTNADDFLSLDEFIALPLGEVEGDEFREMDKQWQQDRKHEFNDAIDTDHNGKVSSKELKLYLDPRNPIQALMEARNLISLLDDNKDKMVSQGEINKHRDIFITSKVVDFAANVHDEF